MRIILTALVLSTGTGTGEGKFVWIAQAIDGDVDLARQAAARTSDGLILSPPFAPAAC